MLFYKDIISEKLNSYLDEYVKKRITDLGTLLLSIHRHAISALPSNGGNYKYGASVIVKILLTLALAGIGTIGGYLIFSDIKPDLREIRSRQSQTVDMFIDLKESITEMEKDILTNKKDIKRFGFRLTSLDGKFYYGRLVFYPPNIFSGHPPGKRVCALSTTAPWHCTREVLFSYEGRKVRISVEDHFHNSLEFEVVGFFPPKKPDGRIVQISTDCLADLVGKKNIEAYIKKGVIYCKVMFPKATRF